MLQRAASNAYSWWWASHIRTKQSKWMEQNLQDMEEKVQYVLKLIEEDGDSFARRAEMYYKKRPELIQFVEESYRAYRALAERYDHLSTELQNANSTLASVFPEQVQFAMEDDDDESLTIAPKKAPAIPKANIPKVPNAPKELKRIFTSAPKRLQSKKSMKVTAAPVAKSGLNKSEGLQEIDKLQKQILALQTEKEFVKSSYEGSLAKYWQIEGEIEEMQKKVCSLQDEFGAGTVIEDSEARTLMASAALKSCQETLTQLQQKQEKSAEEAIVERKKINNAREKLKSLKKAFQHENNNEESPESNHEYAEAVKDLTNSDQEPSTDTQEKQDLELLRDKIRQHFDIGSNASLSVTELAEQIDELVNKVINLEASVSSQTALIQRLRAETDDLQAQIGILEEDKVMLISGKNDLRVELRETEKKLHGLEELNKSVEDQNNNLQSHFAAAYQNLDHLNQKLHTMMPDEELQTTSQPELESSSGAHVQFIGQESALDPDGNRAEPHSMKQQVKIETSDSLQKEKARDEKIEHDLITSKTDDSEIVSLPWTSNEPDNPQEKSSDTKTEKKVDEQSSPKTPNSHLLVETQEQETKQEAEPDWKYLFTKGMENKEKLLLNEYTAVLRNFKDVKKQLAEVEKKNGDGLFELTVHVRELRSANAKKDELIRVLRQKLNLLQTGLGEDNESEKSCLTESSTIETDEDKLILMDQQEISQIEQKFRMSIDEVLEENLDFWLRFSTTFHQIQKFQTEIKDLQAELLKLEGKKQKQDGSSASKYNLKSDAKPLYKHLREIHTELSIWLETSVQLKDELKSRFSSLCNIQEEIIAALKDSAEDDDFKFTSYQAAKFQGEILNMKQENNKVADELQVGLDHVTTLQLEVEKALAKLNEEFKLSGSKHLENVQLEHSGSRARVPLRSFIFGVKQKKQKNSFFSCVHPVLQKKYNGFKAGINV